jgi:hypothetical protein
MATAYPILLSASKAGTLLLDQQIPNTRYGTPSAVAGDEPFHRHLIDIYEPQGDITMAIVPLHGGGGTKYQYAAALGILRSFPPTPDGVSWGALEAFNTVLLVPQGQACHGVDPAWGAGNNPWNPDDVDTFSASYPIGIPTWSNHTMWSGVDDMQFVKDIAAFIANRYGAVLRVLTGHSNGGIMSNEAWYQHETGMFNVYCGTSGPASIYRRDVNPTPPSTVRPFCGFFGNLDTNLQIYPGHWQDPQWQLSQLSKAMVAYPFRPYIVGEMYQLQTRVNAYNAAHSLPAETVNFSDGVVSTVHVGTCTTWTYSGGANIVKLYSDSDHATKDLEKCAGHGHITDWALFALSNIFA